MERNRFSNSHVAMLAMVIVLPALVWAQPSEPACGSLENSYGPFDYRTQQTKLSVVNRYHFTPDVEALSKGSTGALGGDLDYTLRASPNHHRALLALLRMSEHTTDPQPSGLPRPLECYFDRALRFQRDDPIPRMIYARFLAVHGRQDEVRRQLAATAKIADDSPMTRYNIGLIYFEIKDYAHALEEAHKARSLGFAATGLQDRLKAAGQWREQSADSSPSGGEK